MESWKKIQLIGIRDGKNLKLYVKNIKRNKGRHNVIVPYSGGKDGAMIAYMLKHKLGMNPLCITIRPPLEEEIGIQNIQNFIQKGYEHLMITPNREIDKLIDKDNFINRGIQCMHLWLVYKLQSIELH